jgi:hypothetical protein
MEYVQQVLVQVQGAKMGDAKALTDDLEAHRRVARGRRGFAGMQITRQTTADGNLQIAVESRWKSAGALDEYAGTSPNAYTIINKHSALHVPGTLEVNRLEGVGSQNEGISPAYERLLTGLAVPLAILAFGLAFIYLLSRFFLSVDDHVAVAAAAFVAIAILGGAWLIAANPQIQAWQYAGIGATAAAVIIGAGVYGQINYEPSHGEAQVDGEPTTEPGGGDNVIQLHDNFFQFNGQRNPTITEPANQAVTLDVSNEGNAIHNVHVSLTGDYTAAQCKTGGDVPCSDPALIRGGGKGTLTFTLAAGSYNFRCDFHPTEMTGTFQIQ